jgi:hypothetical protein
MTQKIIISGFRTRKEVRTIVHLSPKGFYNLLTSEPFKEVIPKKQQLSPAHQALIFTHLGIPYEFDYSDHPHPEPNNQNNRQPKERAPEENKKNNR